MISQEDFLKSLRDGTQSEVVKLEDVDPESLRFFFLGEEEFSALASQNPYIGLPYEQFCPTCNGSKVLSDGSPCDCELQSQLFKVYTSSGIGRSYQTFSWKDLSDDFYRDNKSLLSEIEVFRDNSDVFVSRGTGFVLSGTNGAGKTSVASLLLKDLLKKKKSCFSVTAYELVSMETDSWEDKELRVRTQKKLFGSDILLVDDLGKERETVFTSSLFEELLRRRVQSSKSTIFTTNLSQQQASTRYSVGFNSLLSESGPWLQVVGGDFRTVLSQRFETGFVLGSARVIV